MDAANLLKPLLTVDKLRFIGATTYQEYRQYFLKDQALSRRFQKIDVTEPSVNETLDIINGMKLRFEQHHGVQYTQEALRRAVELSSRYMNDRRLPDKAIDIVDESGAYASMSSKELNKMVNANTIDSVFAKIANISQSSFIRSDSDLLSDLIAQLQNTIFDQNEAIEAVVSAMKIAYAGLRNPHKPIGAFLFAGPTGVGKTALTQQLASSLHLPLLRFDMSEFMQKNSVSQLIGSPPGYVGFEQGGQLTEAVIKQPHAVLLLDEVEKAHRDVLNVLLQVMDHGLLTDSNGRKADFKHVIIIMTTNVGSFDAERCNIGFSHQVDSDHFIPAIQQNFSPEFRNRLDDIIQFQHLKSETVLKIVNNFLIQLGQQLKNNGLNLDVSSSACQWIAEHSYDMNMGARLISRLIDQMIKQPVVDRILDNDDSKYRTVKVDIKDQQLTVTME